MGELLELSERFLLIISVVSPLPDIHVCLPSQFKCTHPSRCIPGIFRCNGQDNCGEGEDEKDCRKSLTVLLLEWHQSLHSVPSVLCMVQKKL